MQSKLSLSKQLLLEQDLLHSENTSQIDSRFFLQVKIPGYSTLPKFMDTLSTYASYKAPNILIPYQTYLIYLMKNENILSLIGLDASPIFDHILTSSTCHLMTTPCFQNMINCYCFDPQNQYINNGVSIKFRGNQPTDLTTYIGIVIIILVLITVLIIILIIVLINKIYWG